MNIEKVSYDNKMFIKHDGKKLIVRTPPMRLPFGCEEYYGKIQFKLEFSNMETDPKMKRLYESILELEEKNMEHLSTSKRITEEDYKSCIFKNEHSEYPPLLIAKVEKRRNHPVCKIIGNEEYTAKTIYEFKSKEKVICDLAFERLWKYEQSSGKTCGMLVKIIKIICV